MSEQLAVAPPPKRRRIQVKLERLRSSQYGGMFGVSEIIALGGAALVLLLVIISYLYFLLPARSNLETARLEAARLQKSRAASREDVLKGKDTEARVVAITDSLDSFENNRLSQRVTGRMVLYEAINELMRQNSLRNTSGPTYAALESSAEKKSGTSKSANTKWQSVYPGIAINVTVEGQYANLRRFVRDIEGSKLFLIINAIELERAETNAAAAAAAVEGESGARPTLVSLRLDMATYFQRADEGDTETQTAQ